MRLYRRMNRYSHTLFALIFNSIKSETRCVNCLHILDSETFIITCYYRRRGCFLIMGVFDLVLRSQSKITFYYTYIRHENENVNKAGEKTVSYQAGFDR